MSKLILLAALIIAIVVFTYMFVGNNGKQMAPEECDSDGDCTVTIGTCDCYAVSKNSRTTARDIEGGRTCVVNECLVGVLQPSAICANNKCELIKK